MMKPGQLLVMALLSLLVLPGCKKAGSEGQVVDANGVSRVDKDDPEMNAAMARARAEIEPVLTKLEEGGLVSFSIKVPVTDGSHTEFFWLNNIDLQDGIFTGTIDNDPELVHNVKLGDKVTVKKSEVADWLYTEKDGKMHGNFTLRVLLKRMPAEDAAKYKDMMAD